LNYGSCTLPEGQLIIDVLLDASLDGTGKNHLTPIFPCGIFQLKKGVNERPGDPNYYLFKKALKSTSKRIYPNYANCDWSNQVVWKKFDVDVKTKVINELNDDERTKLIDIVKNDSNLAEKLTLEVVNNELSVDGKERPYEFFGTMGCRTVNGADINFEEVYRMNIHSVIETGKMKCETLLSAAQKDGRGNIAPTTIILPALAMEALDDDEIDALKEGKIIGDTEKKLDKFMRILSRNIDYAKDGLIERFEYIAKQSPKSAPFMYKNSIMAGYIPEEGIKSALKHGTLVIGNLGLAECLQILIGKNHTTEEGMDVAKRIFKLFKKKCNEFKEEYHLNFGVYNTPAENLCYTAMKKFKNKYGTIPDVSDRPYFTNSMHVPVWEPMTPFKKIDIESQLTGYSTAGCITYTEVDSKVKNNLEALEEMVIDAMEHDIPYFAVNFPIDNCLECGYSGEFEDDKCPMCGTDHIEHLGRVTGYLSSDVRRFNYGKQNEFKDRVDHEEHILI
jgi:ribonucleoside-triphosphate reductase (formate)